MLHDRLSKKGFSLVELLVSIAILGLVLAGIYGLLNSAYQTYMNTRRRSESQQSARLIMDYLTFRLREIDGANATPSPWKCKSCHEAGRAVAPLMTSLIPCPEDVTTPRKTLYYTLEDLTLDDLEMEGLPASYKVEVGNKISFIADLLPLYGFSEGFTDSISGTDANGEWDFHDNYKTNGVYDYGETELLDDMNENSAHDFFGENWQFYLSRTDDRQSYELVESVDFSSLRPNSTASKINGKLRYNRSEYDDNGYTDEIVAEGIVSLRIREVPRIADATAPGQYFLGREVERRCQDPLDATACHGSGASSNTTNIYGNAKNFSMQQFVATHPEWNIRGFSVELTTAARKGGITHLTTMSQFVIPRNLEINQ